IADGRKRQRDLDSLAIFAATDGFEVLDGLAATKPIQHLRLFLETLDRRNNADGFADGFFGGVTEKLLCRTIPTGNDTIKALANNGVVRGFDNRGEALAGFLVAFTFGDVAQISGEEISLAEAGGRDGHFGEKLGSIGAERGHFDAPAQNRAI